MTKKEILDAEAIRRSLWRMAHEIVERTNGTDDVVLIGIERRGSELARRLAELLGEIDGRKVDVSSLDVTPFRDDDRRQGEARPLGVTITDRLVVLVDDVLFTGRTARAAIEAVLAAGRPRAVRLLVLVDRGHRELPIRPDFVGKNLPTSRREDVKVRVQEVDGLDTVTLVEENESNHAPDL